MMGLYDTSDRYLKKAFAMRRSAADNIDNFKIVGPIIKLKSEQFKSQSLNFDFRNKVEKLTKIINVLDSKMNDAYGDGVVNEDNKGLIKGLLLR